MVVSWVAKPPHAKLPGFWLDRGGTRKAGVQATVGDGRSRRGC